MSLPYLHIGIWAPYQVPEDGARAFVRSLESAHSLGMSRGGSRGRWALLRLVSVVSLVPEWGGCLDLVGQLLSRPLPTRSPTYLLRRCPAPECSSDGRPLRRREGPVPPPKDDEDEGFVFGSSALSRSVDALRDGKMILCAEDGEPGTLISVMVLPQHLTEEHVAFVRKHAISLEVSLAPQQYRELYGSLVCKSFVC